MTHLLDNAERRRLERRYVELLWRKCAADPFYFIDRCVWIPSQRDPRGREPLHLFDYQRGDLEAFLGSKYAVVLKARQIGLSTLIAAYALWMALFRPGAVVLWVSDGQKNADKAVGMLDVMWRFLPDWVKARAPEQEKDQAGLKQWRFRDGAVSRIRAYAGTKTAGASETASLVVLDEFALVDDQDDLYRSIEPTVDAGGIHSKLIIISTARGAHNRFAKTFRAAWKGESKFKAVFHPWMVSRFVNPLADRFGDCPACDSTGFRTHPNTGETDYCAECVDTSIYDGKTAEFPDEPWLVHSEYPSAPEEAFRESGNPRFPDLPALEDTDDDWLRGYLEERRHAVVFVEDDDGPLRIRPELTDAPAARDHYYVAYVDPSQGIGADYTACHVLGYDDDAEPEVLAWWWANDIEPVDAAADFNRLGRWFNDALLAVENTGGWGDSILNELNEHMFYPNLYVHTPTGHRRRTKSTKLGFPMHKQRRPLVIDRLAEYVRTVDGGPRLVGIHPQLRHELGTFVRTSNGKVQADTGCHDDLVMSVAGALWVLIENLSATVRGNGEDTHAQSDRPAGTLDLRGTLLKRIERVRAEQERENRREMRDWKRELRRDRTLRTSGRR